MSTAPTFPERALLKFLRRNHAIRVKLWLLPLESPGEKVIREWNKKFERKYRPVRMRLWLRRAPWGMRVRDPLRWYHSFSPMRLKLWVILNDL